MKKIGIITINDYSNYGNRLQNYAVQEVIKLLGYETETIISIPRQKFIERFRNARKKSLLFIIKRVFQKAKNMIGGYTDKHAILINKRVQSFKQFTSKHIKEVDLFINQYNISESIVNQYDAFIVGSDQVWNPNFRMNSPIDFLTFAPKNKRISYAASFGISKLPQEYVEDYKLRLSEMAHISVRENVGAKIIKDLTGREVPVLLDPTMMLNKEKWLSISKEASNKPDRPYLLTYFLGGISPEDKEKIYLIAGDKNLEIVNLEDVEDEERYVVDPAEFLDYINSSAIIFTDSFHGTVFSILFEKPFVVFDRIDNIQSMSSRIDTLLSKFKLDSRKWENVKNTDDIFNIDFSHVPEILEFERKKAIDYLKNALEVKDEK